MKNLLIISLFFTAFALHGVSVLTNTYSQGPTSFTNTIGFTSPGADGATLDYDAFTSTDVFAQSAGRSVYKRGHASGANASYWPGFSNAAQYFYITPESIEDGAQWRTLKTSATGQYVFGGWSAIDSTGDELSIGITAGVAFPRQVGIQIEGVNTFSSFRHYQMASHGIDTLSLAVVPEPSTYALTAGLIAFVFIAIKRRK